MSGALLSVAGVLVARGVSRTRIWGRLRSYFDEFQIPGGRNARRVSAQKANAEFQKPPFDPDHPIVDFETDGSVQYSRVFTEGQTTPGGGWLLKSEDVSGLSPAQIKDQFDLPHLPTHMVDVVPPAGTTIRTGIVNSGNFEGGGGATQFLLRDRLAPDSFINVRPIQ